MILNQSSLISPTQIDIEALKELLTTTVTTGVNKQIVENLNGAIDDYNQTFTTGYDFIPYTTSVFYNGIKQRRGFDYSELNNRTIVVSFIPSRTGIVDDLQIIYEQDSTATGTVIREQLHGVVNNVNQVFITTYSYQTGSLAIFCNGMLLAKSNYSESADKEITLTFAPSTIGMYDDLYIIYNKF